MFHAPIARIGAYVSHGLYTVAFPENKVRTVSVDRWVQEEEIIERDRWRGMSCDLAAGIPLTDVVVLRTASICPVG